MSIEALTNEYTPEALPPDTPALLDAYAAAIRGAYLSMAMARDSLKHLEGVDCPPQIISELKDIHQSAALLVDQVARVFKVESKHFLGSQGEYLQFPDSTIN